MNAGDIFWTIANTLLMAVIAAATVVSAKVALVGRSPLIERSFSRQPDDNRIKCTLDIHNRSDRRISTQDVCVIWPRGAEVTQAFERNQQAIATARWGRCCHVGRQFEPRKGGSVIFYLRDPARSSWVVLRLSFKDRSRIIPLSRKTIINRISD